MKSNDLKILNKYCDDILSGKIVQGLYIKQAVERFQKDWKRQNTKNFPYYFDEEKATRIIKFARLCHHHRGTLKGEAIEPLPHQYFYWMNKYGWFHNQTGEARFTTSLKLVARKNFKTTEEALEGIFHISKERDDSPQCWVGATKEEQARICVNDAGQIILASPYLRNEFDFYRWREQIQRIYYPETGGLFAALGKDHKRQDGFDPSKGIIDEYHEHPDNGTRNIIESGRMLRESYRTDIISTAGYNLDGPCSKIRKVAIDVLNGNVINERFFAMIHELDEGDDWKDEKVWSKPNPSLGMRGGVKLDNMRDEFKTAIEEGGEKEVSFKTKNLNMWVGARATWMPFEIWDQSNKGIEKLENFKTFKAYGSLDLASKMDIAAFTLLINHNEDRFTSFNWFFCPEETASYRSKKDRVDYLRWASEGHITLTPGNATDYNYIRKKILEVGKIITIKSIAYDQWNATHLANQLTDDGANMVVYPQSHSFMSEPTKELEKLIKQGRFNHQGNPVLRWMNGNVTLMQDSNDNIKIDKGKSEEKVDGMVTNVMALGMFLRDKEQTTVYEKRGVVAR